MIAMFEFVSASTWVRKRIHWSARTGWHSHSSGDSLGLEDAERAAEWFTAEILAIAPAPDDGQ
jgi:hypothetical protein